MQQRCATWRRWYVRARAQPAGAGGTGKRIAAHAPLDVWPPVPSPEGRQASVRSRGRLVLSRADCCCRFTASARGTTFAGLSW